MPKLGGTLAVDPVTDRNDHIQIVVFKVISARICLM